MLATLLRNVSWNYVEAAVSLIVYFLLTPFVVEHLGVVGYGLWVLLNTILFYLRFFDLGFHNALVKYVAEHSEKREWYAANALISGTASVLLLAGVAALVASAAIAWLLIPHAFNLPAERIPELQLAAVLLGVDLLLAFPASVLNAVLEGRQRFDILSAGTIATLLIGALATVFVLHNGYDILALVWIEIAKTVFMGVLFYAWLRKAEPQIRVTFGAITRGFVERVRHYSTWTSLNEILAEGGSQVEKLLIPIVLSVALLTPYTLICTVAAVIFLAVEPITEALFPLSSAFDAKGDRGKLREILTRGTKLVMAVSLPIAVAVTAYGGDFLLEWVGDEHIDVPTGVLPLVATSFAVTAFILPGTTILLALERVKEVFWMGITELTLAVVLVFVSVPRLELIGLAGSLLVANVVITFLWIAPYVARQLEQSLPAFLWTSLARPLLAIAPMALAIVGLDALAPATSILWLVLKSGVAGLVYLAAFWSLSLDGTERSLCIRMVRNFLGPDEE